MKQDLLLKAFTHPSFPDCPLPLIPLIQLSYLTFLPYDIISLRAQLDPGEMLFPA